MTSEFVSRVEVIMPAVELPLKTSRGFESYSSLVHEESIRHPAKFNVYLLEFLINEFTNVGDTILDPFAGTGILGVVAAINGRNAYQIEVEEEYYSWMEKARELVEGLNTLTNKGWIRNFHGDARALSQYINSQVDCIITSPPYCNSNLSAGSPVKRRDRLLQSGHDPRDFIGGKARNAMLKHYGSGSRQIGRLPLFSKKGESYIDAMRTVCGEMYKVLRDGGYLILAIKPIIRQFNVIDLPYHLYGVFSFQYFKPVRILKHRAIGRSLWRILYYRKYPHVPVIAHEYVLVMRKG